ncbi:MAG: hypothetical protein HY319_11765 [Armatimonadetes bacterium]|nr:hypothetical protein [Armatimonadota bacterium]
MSSSPCRAMNLEFLLVIPRCFIFVALAAWLAAFTGMVRALAGRALSS